MHRSRDERPPDETDRDRSCHRGSGTILPMKRLRRKAGLFGLPYRLFEVLFPFIFLHGTACMKQRFFGAQGAEGFSLPAPLTSFLDRERKRFLAFARNDECGEAAFSYRKPSSCGAREAAFSLLPMEGGAPKGRRLASQRTEKSCGGALSRIVIPSAAEGSFSFAIFCFMRESVCMKHRSSGAQGVRCFPLAVPLTSFALPRKKKISRFRSK